MTTPLRSAAKLVSICRRLDRESCLRTGDVTSIRAEMRAIVDGPEGAAILHADADADADAPRSHSFPAEMLVSAEEQAETLGCPIRDYTARKAVLCSGAPGIRYGIQPDPPPLYRGDEVVGAVTVDPEEPDPIPGLMRIATQVARGRPIFLTGQIADRLTLDGRTNPGPDALATLLSRLPGVVRMEEYGGHQWGISDDPHALADALNSEPSGLPSDPMTGGMKVEMPGPGFPGVPRLEGRHEVEEPIEAVRTRIVAECGRFRIDAPAGLGLYRAWIASLETKGGFGEGKTIDEAIRKLDKSLMQHGHYGPKSAPRLPEAVAAEGGDK